MQQYFLPITSRLLLYNKPGKKTTKDAGSQSSESSEPEKDPLTDRRPDIGDQLAGKRPPSRSLPQGRG